MATTTTTTDDTSLLCRLSLGSTSQSGSRGSLTRCAVRLGHFVAQQQQQQEPPPKEGEPPDDERATAVVVSSSTEVTEVVHELQLAQLELTKLFLQLERYQSENKEALLPQDTDEEVDVSYQNDVTQQLAKERQSVQELRRELQQAQLAQSCLEEYESLAKMTSSRHPTSRRILQSNVQAVEAELKETQHKLGTLHGQLQVRRAQFQLLMQSMLDLKQSLQEPLELDEGEKQQQDDDSKMQIDDMEGTLTTKKGEEKPEEGEEDDNDEALYNDL